jgi:chromate transporter
VAAFLGASAAPATVGAKILFAGLSLVSIFLPGLLLLCGVLPYWEALKSRGLAQAAMRGINAAVVGVLGAALYDPLWTQSFLGSLDFALTTAGFVLLVAWRAPPVVVVVLLAAYGITTRLIG